ncbi:hypothetical protein N7532_008772 [Penicillium argentinense]|uniref:Bud22 domain-containing protein n=1 Tax=Penicillium argentinense TaxID=1131581 RepID=A0A9W9K1Z4_9EURO|nr:uncharacterized protein N7532_008772 [Penicillium argentinense]KAJ5090088.1 hypothetical protein N7532_008772 [Penicillium argentinense]
MPKRKLGELNGSARLDEGKARKMSMRAIRLTSKFEQGVQIISKGLKTARGFERQKLSRREKTARSDNNRLALIKLGEEIEALKGLDYHITAERYLYKQLFKTKRIAELPTFQEFQEAKNVSTEGPKSTAEANILARLFKSNPVQNVMPGLLADIRKLLGVDNAPAGNAAKKDNAKKEAPKKEKASRVEESESESEYQVPQKRAEKMASKHAEQDSEFEEDVNGPEGEVFDSDELAQFDSRLAPGSGDEEESDSGDDEKSEGLGRDDISDSVSRSPSPDFSAEESPPPKKVKANKVAPGPVKDTTFLPSLMMGGYWSGSEEASDDEAAGPPKRKNRMGQQARRALWEKKYGAGANHIKKEQKEQKRNRDSGWDMKRGATGGGRGGRGGRGGFGGRSEDRGGHHSGHGGGQGGKPPGPPKDEGPLHPSWEAKRKQKEQTTAAFQGKKVVFD